MNQYYSSFYMHFPFLFITCYTYLLDGTKVHEVLVPRIIFPQKNWSPVPIFHGILVPRTNFFGDQFSSDSTILINKRTKPQITIIFHLFVNFTFTEILHTTISPCQVSIKDNLHKLMTLTVLSNRLR